MNAPSIKPGSAVFLQVVIVLIGVAVLAWMLWEPHIEGRNAHATTFEIYFKDPFLAYAYLGSLPFFVALYRGFGLFGHVRRNGSFSPVTVDALRAIKRCALVLLGFVAGAVVFILRSGDPDDRPAGVFMCLLVIVAASAIATAATLAARRLQRALSRAEGRAA